MLGFVVTYPPNNTTPSTHLDSDSLKGLETSIQTEYQAKGYIYEQKESSFCATLEAIKLIIQRRFQQLCQEKAAANEVYRARELYNELVNHFCDYYITELKQQQKIQQALLKPTTKAIIARYLGIALTAFASLGGAVFAFFAIAVLIPPPAGIFLAAFCAISQFVFAAYTTYGALHQANRMPSCGDSFWSNFKFGSALFFTASQLLAEFGTNLCTAIEIAKELHLKIPVLGTLLAGIIIGVSVGFAVLYHAFKTASYYIKDEFGVALARLQCWWRIAIRRHPAAEAESNEVTLTIYPTTTTDKNIQFEPELLRRIALVSDQQIKQQALDIERLHIIFAITFKILCEAKHENHEKYNKTVLYNQMVEAFCQQHISDNSQQEKIKSRYQKKRTPLTENDVLRIRRKVIFTLTAITCLTTVLTIMAFVLFLPTPFNIIIPIIYAAVAIPTYYFQLREARKAAMATEIDLEVINEEDTEADERVYRAVLAAAFLASSAEGFAAFLEMRDLITQLYNVPVVGVIIVAIIIALAYFIQYFSMAWDMAFSYFHSDDKAASPSSTPTADSSLSSSRGTFTAAPSSETTAPTRNTSSSALAAKPSHVTDSENTAAPLSTLTADHSRLPSGDIPGSSAASSPAAKHNANASQEAHSFKSFHVQRPRSNSLTRPHIAPMCANQFTHSKDDSHRSSTPQAL